MFKNTFRVASAVAVATIVTLAFATPVSAHISPVDPSAPADGFTTVELQVPHGCDGQATNSVAVRLRDDMASVKAQSIPGWTVEYERQALDEPIELHGEQVTEYVSTVTWSTTDAPLPDDEFMRFGISLKMPNMPGETVLFPVVQTCVDGSESAWLDADPEADHPAPAVALTAATDGHGDPADSAEGTGAADGGEDAAAAETASDTEADTSDAVARVIAIIAALLAAAAIVVGFRARSS